MKVEHGITGSRSEKPSFSNPSRHHWWIILFALVTVIGVVISGILPRIQARATLRKETADLAVPTVSVIRPKQSAPVEEVVLPANVQAFADAPIYARSNGYLKRWYADIGAHVKTGRLLAEIETPEIDQQLRQARADLATAEANLNLSRITAERYADLLKTDSVSKQEADNAAGDYAAKQAVVQSARANVGRLEQMQSFERIYAPFDGVITARNTDIGALIDSGSSGGQRRELFHILQPSKLRVYVNVPEAYSQAAKPGLTADLTLSEFPGRRFQGKLVRTANAIDQATRTLLVEILVDNPTGTLLTGAYAEVHLRLPTAVSSLLVPANSLIFRSEGLQVATVSDRQRAELKRITVGHDFGSEVEVVAGLTGNEAVIVNPPDSLISGQTVRISQNPGPEEQPNQKGPQK
ncbi:MAG: efflux transporter periplasmic adaptor subunit [Acidobacteria bacterium]|nr:MAG: efflux transporter periplasmic adaptor subunit [Acidobacteriota bacterium]PYY05371.1 MAG: efflux transporter periplasmic adaptor subunit [Acidobacteriota bacterium]